MIEKKSLSSPTKKCRKLQNEYNCELKTSFFYNKRYNIWQDSWWNISWDGQYGSVLTLKLS